MCENTEEHEILLRVREHTVSSVVFWKMASRRFACLNHTVYLYVRSDSNVRCIYNLSGKIKGCQNVPSVPFSGMRNYFECHEVQARDIATKLSTLLHIDIYYMIIEIICCFWCICVSKRSYRRRCIFGLTCIYVRCRL